MPDGSSLSASLIVPLLYARTSCCAGMLYSWKDVFSRLGCSRSVSRRSPCRRARTASGGTVIRQPPFFFPRWRRGNQQDKSEKPRCLRSEPCRRRRAKKERRCFSLLKLRWVSPRVPGSEFYRLWRKERAASGRFSEEGFRRFRSSKAYIESYKRRREKKRYRPGGKRHNRKDGRQGVSGYHRRKRPSGRAALFGQMRLYAQREREHEHLKTVFSGRPSVGGGGTLLPAPSGRCSARYCSDGCSEGVGVMEYLADDTACGKS